MEIKAKRGDLLAALYWTQSIVERRNTMPILANVLIEAQKGNTRITATDLEMGVRSAFEAELVKEGTTSVNAKKLYEIVREVPNDQVQLKRLENDWLEIRSGKSVFKIVGIDAKEFPQFPKFDSKALSTTPASTLRETAPARAAMVPRLARYPEENTSAASVPLKPASAAQFPIMFASVGHGQHSLPLARAPRQPVRNLYRICIRFWTPERT